MISGSMNNLIFQKTNENIEVTIALEDWGFCDFDFTYRTYVQNLSNFNSIPEINFNYEMSQKIPAKIEFDGFSNLNGFILKTKKRPIESIIIQFCFTNIQEVR